MKTLALFLFLAVCFGMNAQDLRSYRNEKRVVILFPGEGLAEQQALLTKAAKELSERDMVTVPVPEKDGKWHRKYEVQPGAFALILLGKDGDEKFRSTQIVAPAKLFALVDGMPMRKEEMARKSRASD